MDNSQSDSRQAKARLIRISSVLERTGLGRSTAYSLMKSGHFPEPVRLSTRAVAWTEESIESWIAGRPSARVTAVKPAGLALKRK